MAKSWKGEVAVDVGVPVPWEVFAARQHAPIAQPIGKRERVLDDDIWCATERSIADDGILRVGVHIENRCKVQVDPDRAQLAPENHRRVAGQLHVADCSERPHRRQSEHRLAETCNAAAFLIDTDESRKRGIASE